jgi:O-antigen/teichoic acid export membrane protein
MAIRSLLMPVYQSFYPYLSKLLNKSRVEGINFINKFSFFSGLISLILSIILFVFSYVMVNIILGEKYIQSIEIIKILAFFPFITNFGIIYGSLTTLNLGYKSIYSMILVFSGIINVLLAFLLAPIYFGQGIAIALMITETFIAISFFLYLRHQNININPLLLKR